jgi:hypothetical protein
MQNELIVANKIYNWNVPLFFAGDFMKNRECVRNNDGSTSVETQKGLYVDWSKGASGLIIEKGDTVGSYDLQTNLQKDTESSRWLDRLNADSRGLANKLEKYGMDQTNYDFMVRGTLGFALPPVCGGYPGSRKI